MGSEILDSAKGARSPAPDAAADTPAAAPPPIIELDLQPPQRGEGTGAAPAPSALRGYVQVLRTDRARRRTALSTAAVCVVLVALTASAMQVRESQRERAQRQGELAVDLQLVGIRAASRSYDLNGAPANGTVTARVQMHNVGPASIELVGLDITTSEGGVVIANDVTDSTSPLQPGQTSNTTYNLRLPCGLGDRRGLTSMGLTARVRTVDGVVHKADVGLSQVNDDGGLVSGCLPPDTLQDPQSSYSSTTDGRAVTMTIIVGGSAKRIDLVIPRIGASIRMVSTPRLPAVAEPGVPLRVRVTPEVARCSRSPVNFDALQGFSVSIGAETVRDSYLPALVAQAVGRACSTTQK